MRSRLLVTILGIVIGQSLVLVVLAAFWYLTAPLRQEMYRSAFIAGCLMSARASPAFTMSCEDGAAVYIGSLSPWR